MKEDVILQTCELKKYFGEVKAVDGVSLCVMRGQVYGFLGPNGSGKTTTIGMILGLVHPTAGVVRLFGEAVTPLQTKPLRRVGALIGSPAMLPYLSARQNLEILRRFGVALPSKRVGEVLDLVGLTQVANRRTDKFSTGMKQRLGIAMSLLREPELLILDEPTNGMDPAGMYEIRNLLIRLSDRGVTVFISSHLLHEIEQICDHVAVLKKGRMVAEGAVAELIGGHKTVKVKVKSPNWTAELLGQFPGCEDIQTNGGYVTVSGLPSENIVAYLVSKGVVPAEVKTEHVDLEHIYLKLTNGESQEVSHVLEPVLD